MTGIGTLAEGPLHAAVKQWLARPGDRFEVPVDRFVVDLVRADGELVEIQTGGFGPLGPKLDALLDGHRMRIVHPVPAERRIVRVDADGVVLSERRSPKAASVLEVFDRLVAFPSLIGHPHLVVEVLLCREDHVRGPAPTRTGGNRRRTKDPGTRHLDAVLARHEVRRPKDVLGLLGAELPDAPFTTKDLGALIGAPTVLAQRVVYCLRLMELVEPAGKDGRAPLYVRA
ncbi:hypothetical protein [Nocardioides lianchengensis]|uniref:DUF8091 domain-containing protein n=1 Tax=Nocardioides lianchengensis TaxID=1045774 RepID=A0A1G6N4C1_9ACTN|nr:hypothetical protein [Nocardioides lianchengensis]NYG10652.1 hypothetical protein [Nocardioides lianchengensis]SDC62689.1 hypothetical protein SAMN05421872_103137 [Nocardioides lianchengensis]